MNEELPHVKSVRVVVEERRIGLDRDPGNWRTHEFTGLETVPERMPAAFDPSGTAEDLLLTELIREACASGKTEMRFEAPYSDGTGRNRRTILRSVLVNLRYRRDARSFSRPTSPCITVAMPMMSDGVWSHFLVSQVERHLAERYSKLSQNLIQLAVRLAKLDLKPEAGSAKLLKVSESLLANRLQTVSEN